ncbi:MAG: FAD binding domain-containing protein [Rhodobacteraceae bacterium]|nr:FAD binding domain-containing protein [Paracoccaceae bacterium]
MVYYAPQSLPDALGQLAGGDVRIIAGGTDFFPALGEKAAPPKLMDVSRLKELRGISRVENGWRIGAAARWTEIIQADLPPCFDGLKLAAREVGSWQIQNAGTIAGNLCNASPAADGVPPLLSLDAVVELSSTGGVRLLPVADFITGVRRIDLGADELVSAVIVPDQPEGANSHFLKLGARKYLVISIAMVSAVVWLDQHRKIAGARIAVGSCSAVATRLPGLEAALIGHSVAELTDDRDIWTGHLGPLSPISDIRGSGDYRLDSAAELCQRTVLAAMNSKGNARG